MQCYSEEDLVVLGQIRVDNAEEFIYQNVPLDLSLFSSKVLPKYVVSNIHLLRF